LGEVKNAREEASKVIDDNGDPMVVYDGTKNGDFMEFSKEKWRTVLIPLVMVHHSKYY
jgi:hypothetical protein